uniref:Uncharacterized protein n=1 Tax=Romanomermis culicivorax TaxID=13658 RepID=A0A915L0T9_ROMCU
MAIMYKEDVMIKKCCRRWPKPDGEFFEMMIVIFAGEFFEMNYFNPRAQDMKIGNSSDNHLVNFWLRIKTYLVAIIGMEGLWGGRSNEP